MESARFFKFRPINKRMIEALINSELHYALPESFNDPFDCHIDIRKSLDNGMSRLDGFGKNKLITLKEHFQKLLLDVEDKIKTLGVFSCALELENSLMWSHYGDEHRGICFTYELADSQIFLHENEGEIIGMHPVKYSKNPITDWFVKYAQEENRIDLENFVSELAVELLTSKDECWSYEKEGRIFSYSPGVKKINKSSLKQVCFGLRTSQADRDLVKNILNQHGYSVSVCEIVRDENDFGLRAKEVEVLEIGLNI